AGQRARPSRDHRFQQSHRRRARSLLAVGRAFRAPTRPPSAGDRRASRCRRQLHGFPRPAGSYERRRGAMTTESATRIALVYPELLGTYGDGGNAQILATRLRWRGLAAEIVSVPPGAALPGQCDLYLLGGGEDEPQVLAVDGLREGGRLVHAVEQGAVALAVCAWYQIAGESFPGSDGRVHDGVGLLPVETRRSFAGPGEPVPQRAVGDIV